MTATPELLARIDAYWRAANYLSVGQIYLLDNPLLRQPLQAHHVKPRLLGHWGTTPGQNFIYAHLNRVIREFDLDMIYIAGPGHGGPEEDTTWRSPEYGAADSYQRQAEAFAAAVRTDGATDPSADDGVQALRLIEAVAASAAQSGEEVAP